MDADADVYRCPPRLGHHGGVYEHAGRLRAGAVARLGGQFDRLLVAKRRHDFEGVLMTAEQQAALESLRQHAYSLVPVGESKAVAALLAAFSEDR